MSKDTKTPTKKAEAETKALLDRVATALEKIALYAEKISDRI